MIRWADDHRLQIGDTTFDLPGSGDEPTADFTVVKTRKMVEFYEGIADVIRQGRVFEAGIFKGGSTAMFAALFEPSRLVAIDLAEPQNRGLDGWLDDNGLADTVKLCYGVDQTDRVAIDLILDDVIGDELLDLVVDDASHLLGPTTDTFNVLFPRLREGGLYVIEDWSASLQMGKILRRPDVSAEEKELAEKSFLTALGDLDERRRNGIVAKLIMDDPLLVVGEIKRNPQLMQMLPQAFRHLTFDEFEARARGLGFDDIWAALAQEDSTVVTTLEPGDTRGLLPLVTDLTRVLGMHDDLITEMTVIRGLVACRRGPLQVDPACFDIGQWC